jgi:heme-binding NEAT domain protein
MANIADLVLNDGTVDHTFEPFSSGARSEWVDTSSDTTAGRCRAVQIVSLAGQQNKRTSDKAHFRMAHPIEATIDGTVQVIRTNYFTVEVTYGADSTAAERDAFYAMALDALDDAQVKAGLVSLKPTT